MNDIDTADVNTHHQIIDFGKHKGERWTRVPQDYLRWLIDQPLNPRFPDQEENRKVALAELRRRGVTDAEMSRIELAEHAIDRAAEQCFSIFKVDRRYDRNKNPEEGLCAWLRRVAVEAMENGKKGPNDDEYRWKRMRFIIRQGESHPTLVTVMRSNHAEIGLDG